MKLLVKQLNEDIFLFSDNSEEKFYNSTVIFTEKGPVIIDVLRDKEKFNEISKFIKSKGWENPAAIIYTHWHIDHSCGNQTFRNHRVISHQSTFVHLKRFINHDLNRLQKKGILDYDVEPVLPTETFDDQLTLEFANKRLELIHSPGHSYDSTLVYDPDSKILIAGDNIVGEEVPLFLPPVIPPDEIDASPVDLEKTYEIIRQISPDIIIPGHGSLKKPGEILENNKKRYRKCLAEGIKNC